MSAVVRGRRGQVIAVDEYPRSWWAQVGQRLDEIAEETDPCEVCFGYGNDPGMPSGLRPCPVCAPLPDSLVGAEEHTDRMERFDDERLAADAGGAREALLVAVLGVLLAAGSVPASVWAVLS